MILNILLSLLISSVVSIALCVYIREASGLLHENAQ
jgi:hypothetical protein